MLQHQDLKSFLDEKYSIYAQQDFIQDDPIQIPHRFSQPQDIEVAGLFAAIFAWGQRTTIINKCNDLLTRMDGQPFEFVQHATEYDKKVLKKFVHRTFSEVDILHLLEGIKTAYKKHRSLAVLFAPHPKANNMQQAIANFRAHFARVGAPNRTLRHLPNPLAGSAAKRINMYLRWMVRKDAVDFGLWQKSISPALLSCPLDVHSGRVARKLGLLNRKQNDWKAVEELDAALRKFDPKDPVKYDFALFGLGVYENF